MFFSFVLIVTDRNAGIKITHGVILRSFAPQGRHVPQIIAKFSTSEETKNPLRSAKFHVDRSICGDF